MIFRQPAATIASTFPNTTVIGFDPSSTALSMARERVAEAGLGNVSFVEAGAEFLPADTGADLVICFDCLHDMPRPDKAATAIRRAIKDDGTWLIKDIRSSGSFEKDRRNPMLAMFYGFSVASCLQSALSEPDGLGLGTLGLHRSEPSNWCATPASPRSPPTISTTPPTSTTRSASRPAARLPAATRSATQSKATSRCERSALSSRHGSDRVAN